MIDFSTRVAVAKDVLVRGVQEEAVLLNLNTEYYFGLDSWGARMFHLLTTSPSIDDAYRQLLSEFDVAPELLRENLQELLQKLLEHGLITILPTSHVESASAL